MIDLSACYQWLENLSKKSSTSCESGNWKKENKWMGRATTISCGEEGSYQGGTSINPTYIMTHFMLPKYLIHSLEGMARGNQWRVSPRELTITA